MVLAVKDLIGKGYLHDHAIPPLTTKGLADKLNDLPTNPADDIWTNSQVQPMCGAFHTKKATVPQDAFDSKSTTSNSVVHQNSRILALD